MNFLKRLFGENNIKPGIAGEFSEKKHEDVTYAKYMGRLELSELACDAFAGLSFLLADDNGEQQKIISNFLNKYGAEVHCAPNGKAALQMYLENPDKYDFIFMDIQMPTMSGSEAAKKIRNSGLYNAKSIPIVAVSGNTYSNTEDENNFDYILSKSFSMETLAYFIKYLADKNI